LKTFRKALQKSQFTITAEPTTRHAISAAEVLRQAEILADSIDAIHLPDSPLQFSPLALSSLLIRKGIDPIPGLSCRDRNRIALQSDLLGLRAIGVTSLVLDEGSRVRAGDEPGARPIFDVNCRELVAMANAMNEEDWADGDHEFIIGTGATVFAPEPGWSPDTLQARAAAGARFLLTRPCFDVDVLRLFLQGLVETRITWNYSVIVTLEQEDSDSCAELIGKVYSIPGISGVNLKTLGNPMAVKTAIGKSGIPRQGTPS